jgi:hypothetical protein
LRKELNTKLNRYEIKKPEVRHAYIKDFTGFNYKNNTEYQGYVKCKLVHDKGLSVVFPDQVYLEVGDQLHWIQPFFFGPNIIHFLDDENICRVPVDISCGVQVWVEFKSTDVVSKLQDGSVFYRCKIEGPKYLYRYTTGKAVIANDEPAIQLFHHTTKEAVDGIKASKEFRSSAWNIQGTKKLLNIAYLYLTSLPKIRCDDDLYEIAMSSSGTYPLRLDQNPTENPDLSLEVYRSSSAARAETLSYWVRPAELATQPVYKHTHGATNYEIVGQFIHRMGVVPKSTLNVDKQFISANEPKVHDYCVIGDASTLSGLQAPLDEECPDYIFKVQSLEGEQEITGFWYENQNTDQFTNREVKLAEM